MDISFALTDLVALGTLVILEVVLGIDNLLFIAILTEKLPPRQRDKARFVGLSLALLMRLFLLSLISWVVSLTYPVFSPFGHPISWRDLILLVGGFFLLYKATRELHERLESVPTSLHSSRNYAGFWLIVLQIVVLDAVFSLDAVITAVGMVHQLYIMMLAVIIAVGIMLMAAKPLAHFVAKHPTIVVLCLSFLLLIGLSLIAEGLGFYLPKGYLYAAIAFSILIECFNQIAAHNERKYDKKKPMRLRTAEAVLRLLGSDLQALNQSNNLHEDKNNHDEASLAQKDDGIFAVEEVDMVSRVLTLSTRTARSIMTHRGDAIFIDLDKNVEDIQQVLLDGTPEILPVCQGGLDNVLGIAYAVDLLADIIKDKQINTSNITEACIIPESMKVTNILKTMRDNKSHVLLVADEYGSIEGIIHLINLLEAITGELPEEGEELDILPVGEGVWNMSGSMDVHYLERFLGIDGIISDSNDYTSLAGFILARLGSFPRVGDKVFFHHYEFKVLEIEERRISLVQVKFCTQEESESEESENTSSKESDSQE